MQFIASKQYEQISDNIENGIRRNSLEHKAFIGGPEVTQLEKMLSRVRGVKHTICCASGTDALTYSPWHMAAGQRMLSLYHRLLPQLKALV